MESLEIILKLWVLFQSTLNQGQSLSGQVEGVNKNSETVIHIEIVNHVFISKGLSQFSIFFLCESVEANLGSLFLPQIFSSDDYSAKSSSTLGSLCHNWQALQCCLMLSCYPSHCTSKSASLRSSWSSRCASERLEQSHEVPSCSA